MRSTRLGVLFASLALGAALTATANAQKNYPHRLQWWANARFGMFIHWGPISLKAAEISWSRANTNPKCPNNGPIPAEEYDNLYKRFDPVKFDASAWVATAKRAGMKYMVLTAKHCDGFLLWNSKVSDYNIMHTPFKRDVCGELAKAAHAAGMRIGWYFSPIDWKDPDCRNANNTAFVKRMQAEIRELLTNYGKIDLIWFDYDGGTAPWDQANTYALVKKLQPDIVINNRLDLGPNMNAGLPSTIGPNADYCTPEQWIGGFDDQHPWESCMTISRKGQWSWGGSDDGVKPLNACLDMLIGCAGGDGNVLLDVGPMPDGEIAPEQADRLEDIGAWWSKYGYTLGGTRGGPYKPGDWGASTRSGNKVYLHIRNWDDDPLVLPNLPAKLVRARVLTGGTATISTKDSHLRVSVPAEDQDPEDTIVELEFDHSVIGIPAMEVTGPANLALGMKASASNVFQGDAQYAPDKAIDGKNDTRWATDSGLRSAWLEVDFKKPETFGRVRIVQAFPELQRIKHYQVEAWLEGQWKPCFQGENLGPRLNANFPAVTSEKVRLNITESTDGPTIWEFQVFAPNGSNDNRP
jgi:alpha-L-fucosidase